jgi:hypothetical protein
MTQSHVLHRSGRRADVAGMRGIDEDDTNIVEAILLILDVGQGFPLPFVGRKKTGLDYSSLKRRHLL